MEDLGDPFEEAAKEAEDKENGVVSPEQQKVEEIAAEKPQPSKSYKSADEALESVSMHLAERQFKNNMYKGIENQE
jgi:hypothetical protein